MKKVLAADDQVANRELVRALVEHFGHVVFEAGNGIEALQIAREIIPDLILLDLHMPELDGFGVLQELRRDARFTAIPIVALTASAMRGDREKALAAGFAGYIAKPVSLSVLRGQINHWLG